MLSFLNISEVKLLKLGQKFSKQAEKRSVHLNVTQPLEPSLEVNLPQFYHPFNLYS